MNPGEKWGKGCACTFEAGDSPCPVHGLDEEMDPKREAAPPKILVVSGGLPLRPPDVGLLSPTIVMAREAAPEACPDHNEPWVEGTPCPTCGGKRVWHSGLGSTTTDEHQKCLGTCGMERTVDGIDS